MALSEQASGTQTATLTTEHALGSPITTEGIYCLKVDVNALVDGEDVTLRLKVKVRATGTTRLYREIRFQHAMNNLIRLSAPVPIADELVCTLEQNGSLGVDFPWAVVNLGNTTLSETDEGEETLTLATPFNAVTKTDGKTYVFLVDTANLADGESLTMAAEDMVLTSGTRRILWQMQVENAQHAPVYVSPPVPALREVRFVLEQNGGTGRAFPWSVMSLD